MVVLVDTSVWASHFRHNDPHLAELLQEGAVALHPFVLGELACGHLRPRGEVLTLLRALPEVSLLNQAEILHFIEKQKLAGSGVGFVDAHLLAAAQLMRGLLWTADSALRRAANKLDLAY